MERDYEQVADQRMVKDFIASQRMGGDACEERLRWHRRVSGEQFLEMMSASAEAIMRRRGCYGPFVVDDGNRPLLRQMYYYFTGDRERCAWNVDRGLFLHGRIGCGKTLLMGAFLEVVHGMCRVITRQVQAKQLYDAIQRYGYESPLVTAPLFIDELGRESLEINEFGKKIRPVQDLFALRYESGARTFVTSNFTTAQLEGKESGRGYGSYVRTRMEEMMNIVEMPGGNRRPQYIIDNGKADKD